mgnify:CR=1 FL=1
MNNHFPFRQINRRGFSLVESLVTLVVMLLILAGATTVFVKNQQATGAHISLAMMRANLRFGLNTLCSDMRQIGAYLRGAPISIKKAGVEFGLIECTNTNWTQWIAGTGFGHYGGYDATIPDRIRIVEPDIINDARLRQQYDPPSSQMKAVKLTGEEFVEGDLLLITNSTTFDNPWDPGNDVFADLFVPTTIQGPQSSNPFTEITANAGAGDPYNVNAPNGLAHSYPAGSTILKINIYEYYIDATDPEIPRLMRRDVLNRTEEIAAFVEDMQVALGIDSILPLDNNITGAEWITTGFTTLTEAQLNNLRAMRISLTGRTMVVAESMAGSDAGARDVYYRRPAVEDRAAGAATSVPYFREVYRETIMFRNLRPVPQN